MMAPSRSARRALLLYLVTLGAAASVSGRVRAAHPTCPVSCSVSGLRPSNWTQLPGTDFLQTCDGTFAFDLNVYANLDSAVAGQPLTMIRACASDASTDRHSPSRREESSEMAAEGCVSGTTATVNTEELSLLRWTTSSSSSSSAAESLSARGESSLSDLGATADMLAEVLSQESNCESSVLLSQRGSTTVGLFVGAEIQKLGVAKVLPALLADRLQSEGAEAGQAAVQLCNEKRPSTRIIGVFADFRGNVSAVQEAIRLWSQATCLTNFDHETAIPSVEVATVPALAIPLTFTQEKLDAGKRSLEARAECRAIQAVSGDGCISLADRCGISINDFYNYNSKDKCDRNAIDLGEYVCCSSGSLPNLSPQKNADGSCMVYELPKDEALCWQVAQKHYITSDDIEKFNKNTWGWGGCNFVAPGKIICVSEGDPPMPPVNPEAACGPQVRGTQRPTNGTKLAELNPCPLNACCSAWGFCGPYEEFCARNDDPGPGIVPGTAEYGCISNCGTEITNNDRGPDKFFRLGYFEGWNTNRPCANMDVSTITDSGDYTHIHFAFGEITPDMQIDVSSVQEQFDGFLRIKGPKKILSFGGWAFSAEAEVGRWMIFRNAVLPGNAERLAQNVVDFIARTGLDGVDFDWEYPGAPDLPDIPSDSPQSGPRYLEFLKLVKQKLPSGKSLSIAAPSSFWYLRNFPIKEIGEVVDYIVYMAYDFHGQWDYGNEFSVTGCKAGNCLRSHINLTETMTSLALITKAGVPSRKILVGISSYGRSFKMSQAGCTGPMCTFEAIDPKNESAAAKGECTDTAGYISELEIRKIISDRDSVETYHDKDSDSDVLVYDGTEWVAWMDSDTKDRRVEKYKSLNFGGTSDWAIDLVGGSDDYARFGGYDDDGSGPTTCDFSQSFSSLEDLEKSSVKAACMPVHALQVAAKNVGGYEQEWKSAKDDYDHAFDWYVKYIKEMVPVQIDACMNWIDNGPCNKFFECTWSEGGRNGTRGTCPLGKYDTSRVATWKVYYDLKDADGFYKTLEENYGISKDWVKFGEQADVYRCTSSDMGGPGRGPIHTLDSIGPGVTALSAAPVATAAAVSRRQCEDMDRRKEGYPLMKDDIDMPNPKAIVEEAVPHLSEMRTGINAARARMAAGVYNESIEDAAQVLTMPVYMVAQAIESMKKIKEVGGEYEDQVKEQEKKELILTILTVVLFFIPFVGEAAGALGFTSAMIGRIALLIGMAGDIALTVVDAIDNPMMAPVAALGLLVGGGVSRSGRKIGDLAEAKKTLRRTDELAKIGPIFSKLDDKLNTIVTACRR